MRSTVSEGHVLVGVFDEGSTVTISIISIPDNILIVDNVECIESIINGIFYYTTELSPTGYTQYIYVMTDGTNNVVGTFDLGGYPDTLLLNDDNEESTIGSIKLKTDLLKDAWNDLSESQINDQVGIAIANYGVPTKSELDSAVAPLSTLGRGSISWTYTLTDSLTGRPISDAEVWVSTDSSCTNVIASGRTNQYGICEFNLDSGIIYVWRSKTGYSFSNPDSEVVSA